MRSPRHPIAILAALAGLALTAAPALAADEVSGKLYGVHADNFELGQSDTRWRLDTGKRTLRVLPTTLPALAPGANEVEVSGKRQGGTVVGEVQPASLQAAPPLGQRKLAVIAVNFTGDTSTPWTTAQIGGKVFSDPKSTKAFFAEESHDRLTLTGQVYGWYTINKPIATCDGADFEGWADAAKTAAAADGFASANYDHVMYIFPQRPACDWAGIAYMPGSELWINGELSVRVIAHELGHNLGLDHASSYECEDGSGDQVTMSADCSTNPYRDPFDNMGAGWWGGDRHSHGWHLERLGVLDADNVQTVLASGDYAITSALEQSDAFTSLRIPRAGDDYYLEIRESGGLFEDFSLTDPVVTGVSIRLNADSGAAESKLLDASPGSDSDDDYDVLDAPFRVGEVFSYEGLKIKTLSAGGGDATVKITLPGDGGGADTDPPTKPTGLYHDFTGTGAVELGWSASTDNTAVTAYNVYRNGTLIGGSGATSYVDATVSPGTEHVYTVRARDAAGNLSLASAPLEVEVPFEDWTSGEDDSDDSTATRVDRRGPAIRLTRRHAGRRVAFAARASDTSGVKRIALFIDGRRMRSVAGNGLRYNWRGRPGRHRVSVNAVDGAGNPGSLSVRLRLAR